MTWGAWGIRADRGGLASEWQALTAHIKPDRMLVIDNGKGDRGANAFDRYPGATVQVGMGDAIAPDTVREFCDGLDTLFAIETFYRPDVATIAREMGVRTVLRANPELYRHDYAPADELIVPTEWERDRLLPNVLVPWPVDRARYPFRPRHEARMFFHLAAPAFHDRNGTRTVLRALPFVRSRVTLLLRGPMPQRLKPRVGHVTIEHLGPDTAEPWDAYPPEADVMLLPRRYAGNCLPMAEAMSLGMPVVSTDLCPQNEWLPAETLIPAWERRRVAMVGGAFGVHESAPHDLARVIDRLVTESELVAKCSQMADDWAAQRSWEALGPTYRGLLGSSSSCR